MKWLSGDAIIPTGSYRWAAFVMPKVTAAQDLQERARLGGYTMPHVAENGMIFSDGGVGYIALIEPILVKTVSTFAEKMQATAAVISQESVPTLLELSLDTKAIVTGSKASIPVEWASSDDYVTGDLWYSTIIAWAKSVPRWSDLERAALIAGVELYAPLGKGLYTDKAVFVLVKPLGTRFRVGALRPALGASAVLLNKHPVSFQQTVDIHKALDESYADLRDSFQSVVVSLSTVPSSVLGLVGSVTGGVSSILRGGSFLIPVALVGALALGGYWVYTKTGQKTKRWRNEA